MGVNVPNLFRRHARVFQCLSHAPVCPFAIRIRHHRMISIICGAISYYFAENFRSSTPGVLFRLEYQYSSALGNYKAISSAGQMDVEALSGSSFLVESARTALKPAMDKLVITASVPPLSITFRATLAYYSECLAYG